MMLYHELYWEREGLDPSIGNLIVGINWLVFPPPPPPPSPPQSPNEENQNEHHDLAPPAASSPPPAMTTTTTNHPRSKPPVEPLWCCTLDAAGGLIVSKGLSIQEEQPDRCVVWSAPSTFCLPGIDGRFTFRSTTTESTLLNAYQLVVSEDYLSLTSRAGSLGEEASTTTPRSYLPLLEDVGDDYHDRPSSNGVGRNVVVIVFTSNDGIDHLDPNINVQDVSALQVRCVFLELPRCRRALASSYKNPSRLAPRHLLTRCLLLSLAE
jgi:hypothetical protein